MEQVLLYTLDEKKPNFLLFAVILDCYRHPPSFMCDLFEHRCVRFFTFFKEKIQTWTFLTSSCIRVGAMI